MRRAQISFDGEVYAHAAERVSRLRVKHKAASALDAGIAAASLSCHVLPDGATVRIADMTACLRYRSSNLTNVIKLK
jgi:hypothetical protein